MFYRITTHRFTPKCTKKNGRYHKSEKWIYDLIPDPKNRDIRADGTTTLSLNAFITVAALIVGAAQLVFLYNLISSARLGKKCEKNPWKANSLEWLTPEMPPGHGNFGKELPVVYRWAYDFNVPGAPKDYIPQNIPANK